VRRREERRSGGSRETLRQGGGGRGLEAGGCRQGIGGRGAPDLEEDSVVVQQGWAVQVVHALVRPPAPSVGAHVGSLPPPRTKPRQHRVYRESDRRRMGARNVALSLSLYNRRQASGGRIQWQAALWYSHVRCCLCRLD